jgi:hypothetical protein
MYRLSLLTALYLCAQPCAQASPPPYAGMQLNYDFSITANSDIYANSYPGDVILSRHKYFNQAKDIMINLLIKKAKSNSRTRYDTDIIRHMNDGNTSFGIGLSQNRIMLKTKYKF